MQPDRIKRDGPTMAYQGAVQESALATNKVLRNTYMLLSATLLWSALWAAVSVLTDSPNSEVAVRPKITRPARR